MFLQRNSVSSSYRNLNVGRRLGGEVPPNRSAASKTNTKFCFVLNGDEAALSINSVAATNPAMPPPTIITSHSLVITLRQKKRDLVHH